MNKLFFSLLVSVLVLPNVYAEEQHSDNFFKQQYRTLCDDVALIRKHYITKSASSEEEKQAAQSAAVRVGGAIAGVAALITVGTIGTVFIIKKCGKKNKPDQEEPKPDDNVVSELTQKAQEKVPEVISTNLQDDGTLVVEVPANWYDSFSRNHIEKSRISGLIMDAIPNISHIKFLPKK